jgi:hypothetical protein
MSTSALICRYELHVALAHHPGQDREREIPDRDGPGCLGCNTLVIFPTGFGKTVIVLKVAIEFLGGREILTMVPTEPLVDQHIRFFSEMLSGTARLPCAS